MKKFSKTDKSRTEEEEEDEEEDVDGDEENLMNDISDEDDIDDDDDNDEHEEEQEEIKTENNKRKKPTPEITPRKKQKKGEEGYILVGGIKDTTTKGTVKSYFKRRSIGISEVIKVPARKVMYLVLEKKEDVTKATRFNNKRLHGSKITVERISRIPSENESLMVGEANNQLLVRNLSFDTSKDKLKDLFEGCISAKLLFYHDSRRPRGLAIINYETVEEAADGMNRVRGQEVDGRTIYICYAIKKSTTEKNRKHKKKRRDKLENKTQNLKQNKIAEMKKRKKENKQKMEVE